jgi:hypothetical protein
VTEIVPAGWIVNQNDQIVQVRAGDVGGPVTVEFDNVQPGQGETATGARYPWSATRNAPSTWFLYTPWVTRDGHRGITAAASGSTPAGARLLAGQYHQAGQITGIRGGGGNSTTITITLNPGWRLADRAENVKINPMGCGTNQNYVEPGSFSVKRTFSESQTVIQVSGLQNRDCYGIHLDVIRP